jgi:hypothetical protein
MENVKNHLILNGRDFCFRIWRGPRDRNSSNEEWEVEFRRPIDWENLELDL